MATVLSKQAVMNILHDSTAEVVILASGAGLLALAVWGHPLVANAVILAVTTTAGLIFILKKLPTKIKTTLIKLGFFSDVMAAVGTYYILGQSVTSLLAAGFVGIMVSMLIWYCTDNPY